MRMIIQQYILTDSEFNTIQKKQRKKKKKIRNKGSMKKFHRMQVYDSIICGYFGIGFISFMFKIKTLTGFTDLLLSHDIIQPFGSRIKTWMERMCVIAKGLSFN